MSWPSAFSLATRPVRATVGGGFDTLDTIGEYGGHGIYSGGRKKRRGILGVACRSSLAHTTWLRRTLHVRRSAPIPAPVRLSAGR